MPNSAPPKMKTNAIKLTATELMNTFLSDASGKMFYEVVGRVQPFSANWTT
jgi:hypothetical protein